MTRIRPLAALLVLATTQGGVADETLLAPSSDRGTLLRQAAPRTDAAVQAPLSPLRQRIIENRAIRERAGLNADDPAGLAHMPDPPPRMVPRAPLPVPGLGSAMQPVRDYALSADRTRPQPRFQFPGTLESLPVIVPPPLATPAPTPPAGAALVQLSRPLKPGDAPGLADQGIAVEGFLGGSTYQISGAPDVIRGSSLGALITAGRMMTAEDKILDAARQQRDRALDEGPETYFFALIDRAVPETLAEELVALGAVTAEPVPGGLVVTAPAAALAALAAHPSVIAVDAGPPVFEPLNDTVRRAIDLDSVQSLIMTANAAPRFEGPTGRGLRVAVYDTPINEEHHDFCTIDTAGGPSRFFDPAASHPLCPPPDEAWSLPRPDLHGTHVAGIIAGSGQNTARDLSVGIPPAPYDFRGIAPEALVVSRGLQTGEALDLTEFARTLARDGAVVSNHSYVETHGNYGALSATVDRIIAGRETVALTDGDAPVAVPARPQVWAAGNFAVRAGSSGRTGYRSVVTQAKNAISVGSVDALEPLRLSVFSSLGPTMDGRIKPDLVAPGCQDSSVEPWEGIRAASGAHQGYARDCGTSMSAPVVSAVVALMREIADTDLRPATYKAILVATAQDLIQTAAVPGAPMNPDTGAPTTFGTGPDFATGFGLIDVRAALDLAAHQGRWREEMLREQTLERCFAIEPHTNGEPFRVALAWDDPPAPLSDASIARLVNDLDLRLIGPDDSVYLPWVLPAPPPGPDDGTGLTPHTAWPTPEAAPGVDSVNTVELVEVAQPVPGRWRAVVSTGHLADGPEQTFSVAANVTLDPDCPL